MIALPACGGTAVWISPTSAFRKENDRKTLTVFCILTDPNGWPVARLAGLHGWHWVIELNGHKTRRF
jgi:hypothetical protein